MATVNSYKVKEILGDYSGAAFISAMRSAGYEPERIYEKVPRYNNKSKKHDQTTSVWINYYDLDECLACLKPTSKQVARIAILQEATE